MNLSSIACRMAGKTGAKPRIRTGSRLRTRRAPRITSDGRRVAECKSETIVDLMSLSQSEFVASQRAVGEPSTIDFVDILAYSEENNISPEDLLALGIVCHD